MSLETTDRRTVLRSAAVIGAGAALAACGGGDDPAAGTGNGGGDTNGDAPAAGGTLGKASDIPVGGGKIFPDQKVVVTQPTEGEFKAFSAVCTHQGCIVSSISGDTINCGCHGSQYSIEDGSVVGGPAPKALAAETVTDDGGTLTLG